MSPRRSIPPEDPRRIAASQIILEVGRGWYGGWAWRVCLGGKGLTGLQYGLADDTDHAIEDAVELLEAALPYWKPL